MAGKPADLTVTLSREQKISEAIRLSIPYLPKEATAVVLQMLQPSSLAIIAGTLIVWAGSHFFGVGELVDAIFLVIGAVTLGFSVFFRRPQAL